jgi:hypothetical protein
MIQDKLYPYFTCQEETPETPETTEEETTEGGETPEA